MRIRMHVHILVLTPERNDKRSPGDIIQLEKRNMPFLLVRHLL